MVQSLGGANRARLTFVSSTVYFTGGIGRKVLQTRRNWPKLEVREGLLWEPQITAEKRNRWPQLEACGMLRGVATRAVRPTPNTSRPHLWRSGTALYGGRRFHHSSLIPRKRLRFGAVRGGKRGPVAGRKFVAATLAHRFASLGHAAEDVVDLRVLNGLAAIIAEFAPDLLGRERPTVQAEDRDDTPSGVAPGRCAKYLRDRHLHRSRALAGQEVVDPIAFELKDLNLSVEIGAQLAQLGFGLTLEESIESAHGPIVSRATIGLGPHDRSLASHGVRLRPKWGMR